jgi:hypothetical protein
VQDRGRVQAPSGVINVARHAESGAITGQLQPEGVQQPAAPSDLARLPIAAGQNRRVAIRQLSKKISRARVPFLPYGDRRSIRGFGRRRTSCAAAPPFPRIRAG